LSARAAKPRSHQTGALPLRKLLVCNIHIHISSTSTYVLGLVAAYAQAHAQMGKDVTHGDFEP
jgi:hypothetical protein